MRKPIIAANWKEYKDNVEVEDYLKRFIPKVEGVADKEIIIAPSFIALSDASRITQGTNIKIAAQNMYSEDSGAFTGEISPLMIKKFCNHAIIGHSERRLFFSETDMNIHKKVLSAFRHGIVPILCIGETRQEKEDGRTKEVIERMLSSALDGVEEKKITGLVIAYEPVWAISRGDASTRPATPFDAQEAHAFIRKLLSDKYGDAAEDVRILYGGSVKPDNIAELMSQQDIDGVLVGGASLDIESFEKIVKFDS